jgi:hypothetical protein
MEKNKSTYDMLSKIDVSSKTEKKGAVTYLSWAWAWAEAKKVCPTLIRTVHETEDGMNYFTDGKTGWVKVGVTIGTLEHIDYLPIMDFRNNSIPLEKITSFEVNKSIQRSTTKALALHGLGLSVYTGEDIPTGDVKDNIPKDVTPKMFTLDIGDANWKKVLGYVADNKELGLTKIVKNLGVKYKVTPKVKTELNKIIKS